MSRRRISPVYAVVLADTYAREDQMIDDRIQEHAREAALLQAIQAWAQLPEAGQPGREIMRLIAEHGRRWVPADPAAETRRTEVPS